MIYMHSWKIEIVIHQNDFHTFWIHAIGNDIFSTVMSFSQKIFWQELLWKKSYDLILFEAVKNAVDAILDTWYKETDVLQKWIVQIQFFMDERKRKIKFLIRDNWAWIYASSSKEKSKWVYFWWRWIAESWIKNDVKKYKRKSTKIWTITEIQLSI